MTAVLLLALAASWWWVRDEAPPRPPNVVLITVESLRPDHVSFQDGERPTTPNLDALAAEGVVYDNAWAVTSWTLASHASIFTGLYPPAHQTITPAGRLGDGYTTLAEQLAARGYQCAGVVGGPYLRARHGLHQGFEVYDESPAEASARAAHGDISNPILEQRLKRFLTTGRDPARPLFLFAYVWDPHYDYIPPEPYDDMFVQPWHRPVEVEDYEISDAVHADLSPEQLAFVKARYEGEIRATDALLGRLFDTLKQQGLWDDTLVIVTADHGEAFFEHGEKGHKNDLYRESVHVPLVVKYPGGGPRGVESVPVSHVDITPTILDVTGTPDTTPLQGRSLAGGPPPVDRPVFQGLLEMWYLVRDDQAADTEQRRWFAMRQNGYTLLELPAEGRVELYDLDSDPAEQHDLAAQQPERVAAMRARLESWWESNRELAEQFGAGGRAELSPQALERLRALGYIR